MDLYSEKVNSERDREKQSQLPKMVELCAAAAASSAHPLFRYRYAHARMLMYGDAHYLT